MALTDDNNNNGNMIMPVAPMYGGNTGGGFGNGNGDWAWLLLILLAFGGGFGNGWGNGSGANNGAGLYPWMNQSNQINDGFRDQMLNTTINGIQNGITSGFGDVQNSLCGGFAGVNATVNGAQNALAQQLYTNQISDLERSFAAQTASAQGMTALQAQLAQCCCDNRAATADLRYTVANEACADRAAVTDALAQVTAQGAANTNALLNTINGGIQSIKDQLCQDKIDAKNELIQNLRDQLTMAQLAASQNAQTAAILANNEAQTNALEQYLAPVPRPAYMVQNPNCCSPYNGCGCGA